MALIHIVRDVPEYKNGSCEMDIQEQDLSILQSRGWRIAEIKRDIKKEEIKEDLKEDISSRVFKKGDK